MSQLSQKKCQPCEGIGQAYNREQARQALSAVPGWEMSEDSKVIFQNYVMKNFMAAVEFINEVAKIAEAENHHPDFHLTGYRKLKIELSTHALGGLSENDFILAAKINTLPIRLKERA
ncbi:MAG: pterin-4-alpha-carbinolamine dehydratase [Omnitrophica WOR_2 bacterium RIFCSPHIGHO2_02_FULL_48_11]|nr:MAG: pterin-4-alpha-carbinolamine dehydratase [Omnitrophica WOR_2 bacterium RIFCSPHIGHO2_02_FULL_48_11]